MGLKTRLKPQKLPPKLKIIRKYLQLSQNEMLKALGFEDAFDRSTISHYESGEREPPLPVLLAYARIMQKKNFKISVDDLIDDQIELLQN